MIQLKRTIFHYFKVKIQFLLNKFKQKIVTLQTEHHLYANVYVACQSREGDLDNFFIHENHLYPPLNNRVCKVVKVPNQASFPGMHKWSCRAFV